MAIKDAIMLGVVGAGAVLVLRKTGMGNKIVSSAGNAKATAIPIPAIAPKAGYGLEWALMPAAVAYSLSK